MEGSYFGLIVPFPTKTLHRPCALAGLGTHSLLSVSLLALRTAPVDHVVASQGAVKGTRVDGQDGLTAGAKAGLSAGEGT